MQNVETRVLLIEDDEEDSFLIREWLRDAPSVRYRIDWVDNVEDALSRIGNNAYDVYLLDYRLGERNGFELMDAMVRMRVSAPVILLTGQGGYDLDVEAMRIGASDYLQKDEISTALLDRSIRHAIERMKAQDALRKAHDELERKVEERTAELAIANQQLQKEIEERKQVEEELRQSEQKYRLLAQNSTDLISKHSPEGAFVYASPACKALLGYEPEELIGRSVCDFLHPEDIENIRKFHSRLMDTMDTPVHHTISFRIRGKDGTFSWFEGSGRAIRDPTTGSALEIVIASREITRRRQMEEELLKARKLEAMGILAGGIAHDFNNILSIVIGNIEIAMEDVPPESIAHECLLSAVEAVLRAKELTHKFIIFATSRVSDRTKILVERLIMESVEFALTGSNVRCRYRFDEGLRMTEGDRGQLCQAIRNLATNACEAMPEGGLLHVSAENIEVKDSDTVTVSPALKAGRYVRITIRDSGPGIPEDDLAKVFDPYFSTKERGVQKGMGLGLTIAHAIIKRHGGCLTLESKPGTGSSFSIYLPASSETEEEREGEI